MGKLRFITLTTIGASVALSYASAQDAVGKAPVLPAPASEPVITPSRYVGDKLAEHIQSLAASFNIASRATDPFGMQQDPEAKPVVKRPPRQTAATAEPTIPFADIVRAIQITTVMAGEKRFLVGSRSIAQGDRFPVNYNGKPIWITVTEVSSRKVEFKNLETGETASQAQNALPAGMTPGTGGIAAPGMTPNNPQAPLDLNSGNAAPVTPPR